METNNNNNPNSKENENENKHQFHTSHKIDTASLKEMLALSIQKIQDQLKNINILLGYCENISDPKAHLLKMADTLEILKTHFEFTSHVMQTNSKEDIEKCKEKFKVKGEDYNEVNSKEDLNELILFELLEFFSNDVITKLEEAIKNSFAKESEQDEELRFKKIEQNSPWIQIRTHSIKLISQFYPSLATFSKTDIFSYPKDSQIWQDLLQLVTYKNFATKEEIMASVLPLKRFLNGFYSVIKNRSEGNQNPDFSSSFSFLKDSFGYIKKTSEAEVLAGLFLLNPNEHAVRALDVANIPFIRTMQSFSLPKIEYDKCINIPRLFPKITRETILNEYENDTINKIVPIQLKNPNLENDKAEILRELFIENEDKVKIRILAPEPLDLEGNAIEKIGGMFRKAKSFFTRKNQKEKVSNLNTEAIVIHFHGGGYVSGSSSSSRPLLIKLTNQLKVIHFSVDYRIAPKNRYPDAIDDIWQAYLWIINYAEIVLGIKHKKVILMGDSAGGNFVMGLTLRLIKAGLNPPDGCFLIYPSLKMNCNLTSPSLIKALDDVFIPFEIRKLFMKLYIPDEFKPLEDPYLSPLAASDDLMKKLPPIRIVIGTNDPLHDDTWRFISRLKNLDKEVKAIIYSNFVHGFMLIEATKNYEEVISDGCEFIRELIDHS